MYYHLHSFPLCFTFSGKLTCLLSSELAKQLLITIHKVQISSRLLIIFFKFCFLNSLQVSWFFSFLPLYQMYITVFFIADLLFTMSCHLFNFSFNIHLSDFPFILLWIRRHLMSYKISGCTNFKGNENEF